MEKLNCGFNVKQMESSDDVFTFEGHLAVFNNVDLGNDKILPTAFDAFLARAKNEGVKTIPAMWSHQWSEPIGVLPIEKMKVDDIGLFVSGELPRKDTFVSGRVIPQMEIGSTRKMSIGYDIDKMSYDGDIRILEALTLYEGSLTPVPMNPRANVTEFKAATPFIDLPLAERSTKWDEISALGRVQEFVGVKEESDLQDPSAQAKYSQAFFWYDMLDAHRFYSYQLPFVDVIDNKLTAVPRGIFAAAARIRGARHGIYVPMEERPSVTRNIERYYNKMGIDSPFGKSFRLDDFSSIDERTLERLLKTGVKFSNKNAVALISALKSSGFRDGKTGGLRDEEKELSEMFKALDTTLTLIKKRG